MKVAIIGAGPTGLLIGLRLSQKGHKVTIFEKEKEIGGLTKTFKEKNWQWPLEEFYHHLFSSDKIAQKIIQELGLRDKLLFLNPKTSILKNKEFLKFDTPLSVLKFPYFSFLEKIRFGVVTLYLKFSNNYLSFEKIKATDWLKKNYGEKVYKILWEPLLKSKFPIKTNQISLSWFWARIKVRGKQLCYLKGSFKTLTKKIEKEIKKNKGIIITNHEIKNQSDLKGFDKIIFTTPAYVLLKVFESKLPKKYKEKIKKLEMLGAVNLVLILKEQFFKDNTYWLSINEKNYPFVAVVEHTKFISKKYYNQKRILYIGGYYPQNHPYFKKDKNEILKEFLPHLKKINPSFRKKGILNYYFFKNLYTQPLRIINYPKIMPDFKTPLKNVFLANMQQVYPFDRGINYAFKFAEKFINETE